MKDGSKVHYAGFWARLAACFIDGLIISVAFEVVLLAAQGGRGADFLSIPSSLQFIASWLYFSLQYSSQWQATLGMRLLGVKVVDYNYKKLSFAHATGRYFAEFLSLFTLGIGFLMIAFTKKKQGLHDMVAKTYVIKG